MESDHLFANAKKSYRERKAARAFLRYLGHQVTDDDFLPNHEDPPDVCVKAAGELLRFELLEVMDKGRRRGDEIKYGLEPPWDPQREELTSVELSALVEGSLAAKEKKYAPDVLASLDALVYVNLMALFDPPPAIVLQNKMWRSVSVLFHSASVVFASPNAPLILREALGKKRKVFDSQCAWSDEPNPPWEMRLE